MDKYYTPDINEFYIGFDYDYDIRETGSDGDYDLDFGENWIEDQTWTIYDTYKELQNEIDCGYIRVKYLDKEDIEELGFIFSGKAVDDWYTLDKKLRLSSGHWFSKFKLQHDYTNSFPIEDDHKYNVKIYGDCDGQEDVLFEGIIKNKSELKKLLKQLGIE
jgi:hypothetical protein